MTQRVHRSHHAANGASPMALFVARTATLTTRIAEALRSWFVAPWNRSRNFDRGTLSGIEVAVTCADRHQP